MDSTPRISHQDFNNKPKMSMLSGLEVKYPSKSCHDLYARLKPAKSMQDKGSVIAMQKLWLCQRNACEKSELGDGLLRG